MITSIQLWLFHWLLADLRWLVGTILVFVVLALQIYSILKVDREELRRAVEELGPINLSAASSTRVQPTLRRLTGIIRRGCEIELRFLSEHSARTVGGSPRWTMISVLPKGDFEKINIDKLEHIESVSLCEGRITLEYSTRNPDQCRDTTLKAIKMLSRKSDKPE